jgi:hypothetical protein
VRLRNELHNVSVSDGRGHSVEGVVRVRGLDARVNGRGFVLERRQPVGVVVHTASGMQRMALPRSDATAGVAAVIAGPLLFLAIKRFFKKGRRR